MFPAALIRTLDVFVDMNIENLQPPKIPDEFFPWLKKASEEYWESIEINQGIFGFQTQKSTKWLPGLSDKKIVEYEQKMGFFFPGIYKLYLRHMNGTDKPTINVYAGCGEPYRYASGYYSYPRDLDAVKDTIKWIHDDFGVTPEFIEENKIPHIMPIVRHKCLVADRFVEHPILSMYGRDTIFYAPSLESFLVNEIFKSGKIEFFVNEPALEVKFWLDNEAASVIEADADI